MISCKILLWPVIGLQASDFWLRSRPEDVSFVFCTAAGCCFETAQPPLIREIHPASHRCHDGAPVLEKETGPKGGEDDVHQLAELLL